MCNLNECLVLEIRIRGGYGLFSGLYRSPNQGREDIESFCTEFDLFLSNINDLSPDNLDNTSTKRWKLDKENFLMFLTKTLRKMN